MNIKPSHFLAATLAVWLLGASTTVSALKPLDITDTEMALLPRFCPHAMKFMYGGAYHNIFPKRRSGME